MSKERAIEACEWMATLGWISFCIYVITVTR